jgi:alpha-1,3-fucosyltransferase
MKSIHKKTKAVVWMVTHCNTQSQRETHNTELGKYIEVDSTFDPQSILSTLRFIQFLPKVLRNARVNLQIYKFYFSFENAICPDNVKNSSKLVNI